MPGHLTIATTVKLALLAFWVALLVAVMLSPEDRPAAPASAELAASPARSSAPHEPPLRTAPVPATQALERLTPRRPAATPRRPEPAAGARPSRTAQPSSPAAAPADPLPARAVPTQEPLRVVAPAPTATAAPVPVTRAPVARPAPRPSQSERFESDGGSGDFELGDSNP